jgi:hypothetical protein
MLMQDYHINIFYSDEDKGYIADIPDLRHCSAFGQTPESALLDRLLRNENFFKFKAENKFDRRHTCGIPRIKFTFPT